MVEILRTNDLVLISVIESILKAERVAYFVADQHMAAVEGSLGFLPRRILVDAREERRAPHRGCSFGALSPMPAPQPSGIGVGEAKTRQAGRQAIPLQGCNALRAIQAQRVKRSALSCEAAARFSCRAARHAQLHCELRAPISAAKP